MNHSKYSSKTPEHPKRLPPLDADDMEAFVAVANSLKENSSIARQILAQNPSLGAINAPHFLETNASNFSPQSIEKLRIEFLHSPNTSYKNIQLLLDVIEAKMSHMGSINSASTKAISKILGQFQCLLNEKNIVARTSFLDVEYSILANIITLEKLLHYIFEHLVMYADTPFKAAIITKIISNQNNDFTDIQSKTQFEIQILAQSFTSNLTKKSVPYPMLGELLCCACAGIFKFENIDNNISYVITFDM